MAYDRQSIKVTWGFGITGTDEIADTSLNFTGAPGFNTAAAVVASLDETDNLQPMFEAYTEVLADLPSFEWAAYSVLKTLKVAAIGTDGHYLSDARVYEPVGTFDGSFNGTLPQDTVVLSLRSGATFGGGNYGRMYLPHSKLTLVTGSPYAAEATSDAMAVNAKNFINTVTDSFNEGLPAVYFPAIMSQAGPSSKGITQVAIGRITDTQRRRRNRLNEQYSFEDL